MFCEFLLRLDKLKDMNDSVFVYFLFIDVYMYILGKDLNRCLVIFIYKLTWFCFLFDGPWRVVVRLLGHEGNHLL